MNLNNINVGVYIIFESKLKIYYSIWRFEMELNILDEIFDIYLPTVEIVRENVEICTINLNATADK